MKNLPLRWNLDPLYKGCETPEYKKDFEDLKNFIAEVNGWAAAELKEPSRAAEKLEKYIEYSRRFDKFHDLIQYASLTVSADSSNEPAKKALNAVQSAFADRSQAEVLFGKFLGMIDGLEAIIDGSEILKEYKFVILEMKSQNKYLLSEAEEKIAARMSLTGSDSWTNMKEELYSTLTAEVWIKGEKKVMPMTAARNLANEADAEIRKAAYEAELAAYAKVETPVAYALNCVKGEVVEITGLRGYKSVLDMTLENARIDRETFEAMISAMTDYLPVFRKYMRKKAQMLGHKGGLPFYDLFAPIGAEMSYTYEQAADFVVKNFSEFSPEMGDFAKHAFENAWIDAEPRPGKQGGAFCSNSFNIKESRILANFSNSFSGVSTLAHELGHAYHGLCIQNEAGLNRHYTMPIAETASTFCETLVCDAALKTASKEEALAILENDISGAAQVIADIYSRFLFEDEVIRRREAGTLSVDDFKSIMTEAQLKSYGDGLDANYLHPYMWICKPHYYFADANYYNFPYAYGHLFSKGLYAEYLRTGKAFVPKYKALLAATGKNDCYEIGRLAGVNVRDKAFWESSLELCAKDIEKFCGM